MLHNNYASRTMRKPSSESPARFGAPHGTGGRPTRKPAAADKALQRSINSSVQLILIAGWRHTLSAVQVRSALLPTR